MTSNIDRLGYYLVNGKKIYNKTLALLEGTKTKTNTHWLFNDDVYGSIDWRIPIETDLKELYRRRAQQLREKYDYLVLYFSGGADSTNILNSFIDHNIFLDEIVMQIPEPKWSKTSMTDLSGDNIHSEIKYSAEEYLKTVQLDSRTLVRYQDYAKPVIELLNNDNWPDIVPMGTHITLGALGKQLAQVTEIHVQRLCENGKRVAQILGIDKPLVYYYDEHYYAYFSDLNTRHSPPVDYTYSEIFNNLYCTEFFYWTPDLPEIVIKQAQEIKRHCELDPIKKQMWAQAKCIHIGDFRDIMHPIIYPGQCAPLFQTNKPASFIIRRQDDWFWESASETVKNNYMNVITHLKNNIDSSQFINGNVMQGLLGNESPSYLL